MFSLAHLSLLNLAPCDLIEVASRAGYDAVGLRLLASSPGGVAYPLMADAEARRAVSRCLADCSLKVFDIEIIRLDPTFRLEAVGAFLETGAALGAQAVLVGADDPDAGRCAANLAALCEAAAPLGLRINVEFMPWMAVGNVRQAQALIASAGTPANAALLVDALHFARSDSTLDDLRAVPPSAWQYVQICDAPAVVPPTVEAMIFDARSHRLMPGEGEIDLVGLLATLPADLPISIEVPHPERTLALGAQVWADQLRVAGEGVARLRRARVSA